MFNQQKTITWQVIAKRLVIKGDLKTAIKVLQLNKIDVKQYQDDYDAMMKLAGSAKLERNDNLAAKMLSDIEKLMRM